MATATAPQVTREILERIHLSAQDELVSDVKLGRLVRRLLDVRETVSRDRIPLASWEDRVRHSRETVPTPSNVVDLHGWLEASVDRRRAETIAELARSDA